MKTEVGAETKVMVTQIIQVESSKMASRQAESNHPTKRGVFMDISNQNAANHNTNESSKNEKLRRSERIKQRTSSSSAQSPLPVPDAFDAQVANDIRYVCDYSQRIYSHYLAVESQFQVDAEYLSDQKEITPAMREILINWLVNVHRKLKLQPQTMYICVNVLDRYLASRMISRSELQLIGSSALWLASKVEEIYCPDVKDLVRISYNEFQKKDLLDMESRILNTLDFTLTFPTHLVFLTRFLRVAGADKQQAMFAEYCLERSLQDYEFLAFKPSLVAACAVRLTLQVVSNGMLPFWTVLLEKHTTFKVSDLAECESLLRKLMSKPVDEKLNAVFKKYSTSEFGEVAKFTV